MGWWRTGGARRDGASRRALAWLCAGCGGWGGVAGWDWKWMGLGFEEDFNNIYILERGNSLLVLGWAKFMGCMG